MTLPVTISLIALISYIGLLALTLQRGLRGNRLRQVFSLYLFDMVLLQMTYLMLSLANTQQEALLWYRFNIPTASAQAIIYFFFTKTFLGFEQPRKLVTASMLAWLLMVVLAMIFSPSVFFTNIYYNEAAYLFVPEFSPVATVLLMPIVLSVSVIVLNLVRGYRQAKSPRQRSRIQYVLLAMLIVWAGLLANVSPALRPYPVDVVANIVSALLVSYAILKYQLLDITLVMRKGILYSTSAIIIGVSYFFIIFLAVNLFHIWAETPSLLLSLVVAFVIAVVVTPLRDLVQHWVDRVFFREKYDGSVMLQRLNRTATSVLNLKKLTRMILDEVTQTMHLQWAAFFLEQEQGAGFRLTTQKGLATTADLDLGPNHPISCWLTSHATMITIDTLDDMEADHILSKSQVNELKRIGAELFLPLRARDSLVGIFGIGPKLSQQGYSPDDTLTLTTLANQVAVAIDNARLYEAVQQELTERKRVEKERELLLAELEAKNAELERFTYTVSHDLKAPLITIGGFLGFLEKDVRTGNLERVKADVVRISAATAKMQQLLNELLELSRIGRMMNPPQAASFETIAREAVELVHGHITARGVEVEIAPNLPVVYGDRLRLVEVMQNLLDNACKFMGDQPQPYIEIGLREDEGRPVFFVRDNGLGIESPYHERIFGLFDKLDPQTTGTGIGLALVQRIIEIHGGKIWVESEGLGHGAAFYFTLPYQTG